MVMLDASRQDANREQSHVVAGRENRRGTGLVAPTAPPSVGSTETGSLTNPVPLTITPLEGRAQVPVAVGV